MPSFFEGLKRVVSGQPVFRPDEDADGVVHKTDQQIETEQQQTQPVVADAVERPGPKIIPEVYIVQVKYRNNGDQMDVDMDVKNHSDRSILIDNITFLGSSRQIAHVLRAGEQREVQVFNGPRPNHRNYTDCEMKYRDETTGDYFASQHFVEYQQEGDQTYVPIRIRFLPPIKDI